MSNMPKRKREYAWEGKAAIKEVAIRVENQKRLLIRRR